VDIGTPTGIKPNLGVRWEEQGVLPSDRVSELLSDTRAGFFAYPTPLLGKSTVFAAYAAHGLIPVTYAENMGPNCEGLTQGVHFVNIPGGVSACVKLDLSAIAAEVFRWYSGHSLAVHAEAIWSVAQWMASTRGDPTSH